MTRDVSPDIQRIRLFLTEPHPCSYLKEQRATTAFVDPDLKISQSLYTQLSVMGFRRSGRYIYTPRCTQCQACIPVRLPAAELTLNRQQKRCLKKNQDLTAHLKIDVDFDEHFPLYESYISTRHGDGDMFPPTQEQFKDFIATLWENSRIIEFRLQERLIAASVVDILDDGLSAIYTYYCPEQEKRSLGTLAILEIAKLAVEEQLSYVYLGYWIEACQKMSYKTRFQPIEMLVNGHWERKS